MSSTPRSDRRENVRLAVLKIRDLFESELPEYALKRRDPREPGRREKEAAEEKLAAVVRRILRKQKAAVRARLEAQYPDRKAIIAPPATDYDLDEEDIGLLIRELLEAARGGILLFGKRTKPQINYLLTNEEAARWARNYSYQLIDGMYKTSADIVSRVIADFVETPGMTLRDVMDRLPFTEERAQTVAVTEITRAFSEGEMIAGRELRNEFPDIPVKKRWYTRADEITCSICEPLDGEEVGIDDGFGVAEGEVGLMGPPAHPNCRCTIETYTDIEAS